MERTMSVEDKIKKAEEIYNKRRENQIRSTTAKVTINDKKNFKLLKKVLVQIVICLIIYGAYYLVVNNNYIFSEDLINKTKEILSYDINFKEIYSNIISSFKTEEDNTTEEKIESSTEEAIGGSESIDEENEEQIDETDQQKENSVSQMEQDAIDVKDNINFIIPVNGTVTSTFGWRNPTTSTVPKYHTGLDIGATSGTEIKSATDGEVILASSSGDYGNHLKIQIGDTTLVYAHCKVLKVGQGEKVTQGQIIAEVGSTGNSTGPHLHFEIRQSDRLIDPQLILEI
jgi:murein DD-endopeptidase MepM/ murein hydrolase activator NlpD